MRHPAVGATPPEPNISGVLDDLSLAEKVGQMTQVELGSITPDEVAAWSIGSVLSGGGGNPGDGTAAAWREAVDGFVAGSRRSHSGIPILYGTDAVHGHNNVWGATIFPHNIGMGASADADLMRAVARASALETAATGARWTFAPCLAVPQDIRWGRTYEGFSQDVDLVTELGAAAVEGWHGDDLSASGVLACAKHFVGEGAMAWGTAGSHRHAWIDWWDGWGDDWQIDQGDAPIDEAELRRVHLPPFVAALEAGALSVMACYGTWVGRRIHEHRYLLTDVLKGELGFEGFVVSDWMALDQLDADYSRAVERAVNAGVDMVMVPFDYRRFISTMLELVAHGRISTKRIDDAVGRILLAKARLGLLGSSTPHDVPLWVVGCSEHRSLARTAVSASVVVIFDHGALPVPAQTTVLAAGQALDDIGIACGGWSISWQGSPGPTTPGSTVLDGLRRHLGDDHVQYERDGLLDSMTAPVGVVTIHEAPYVEGGGDRGDLSIDAEQLQVVQTMRDRVERLIVVVVSGRPLLIEPVVDLADAVVACWLPGTEADAVADVLVGATPATGRLPVEWPRSHHQLAGGADLAGVPPAWPVGHTGTSAITASRRTA